MRTKIAPRSKSPATQQKIAKLAYQFFLDRGCSHGNHMEDWLKAEKIVLSKKKK